MTSSARHVAAADADGGDGARGGRRVRPTRGLEAGAGAGAAAVEDAVEEGGERRKRVEVGRGLEGENHAAGCPAGRVAMPCARPTTVAPAAAGGCAEEDV